MLLLFRLGTDVGIVRNCERERGGFNSGKDEIQVLQTNCDPVLDYSVTTPNVFVKPSQLDTD